VTLKLDRRFLLGCAALLLLASTFVVPPVHVMRPIYDVVAVLDITGSMNTRDQVLDGAPASRLTMEKTALRNLLAALPCGSKLGVAIFVEERPFLLFEPVETCGNFAAIDQSIAGISWRMGWDSESHIAAGLVASMVTARDLNADLVFMTDGQEMPPLAWSAPPAFSAVRGGAGGLIIGVGGHDFVPIPKFDKFGREIGVWKPGEVPTETGGLFKGHEHLTAVDEPHLRALAAETGLTYLHLERQDAILPALAHATPPRVRQAEMDMRFIPACLSLMALLAAHFRANGRRARRPFHILA